MLDDTVSADTDAPPPHRPSYDVFKAIFDAGSDMEISSSEDEDDKLQDEVGEMHTSINAICNEPTQEQVATHIGSSSSDSEDSHQSQKRRHHRRKRKHRRSRSPSNSPDSRQDSDNSTDEYDKKKRKKKKKRHKHKRSHSRHKEKRRR